MIERKVKRGRPRKHADQKTKIRVWRKKQEGIRLDGYVNSSASWRLKKLSKEWSCSLAGVVERLVLEADEKYYNIVFPETETPEKGPLSQGELKSWTGKLCWKGKK